MAFEDKVRNFYNSRADYDNVATVSRATTLVNLFPPKLSGAVVDLATGTGNVAFRAGELVGSRGTVVGLDIAEELLRVANEKKKSFGTSNVNFRLADVGREVFGKNSIDAAYCSFAIMLIDNVDELLRRISFGLSLDGFFSFTSASVNSYLNDQIVRAAAKSGVTIPPSNERFGDRERIEKRLEKSGLKIADIHELQYGKFIPHEIAKSKWDGRFWIHPEQTLDEITEETASAMKRDFDQIIEAESEDGYVWFEEKVYYIKSVRAV
jgi:protein-L-isoaspartate(D-aspartate) O-methyltransferase